jgi:hypothetical protein
MGYIRHEAIVVTGWNYPNKNKINSALAKARELGLPCSDLVDSPMNGYVSFLIAPDGSKEGWKDSNDGDAARAAWKAWAASMSLDWAHVSYGGDDSELASLADHNGKEADGVNDRDVPTSGTNGGK